MQRRPGALTPPWPLQLFEQVFDDHGTALRPYFSSVLALTESFLRSKADPVRSVRTCYADMQKN